MLFTAVPIVEMYLLITVGGYIGAVPTILCVMLTAVVGVTLLRWQGIATLQRGMGRVVAGQLPGQEIVEGMMLAVAGALLLTPGFVTDAFGFLLLMPPVRALLARYAKRHLKVVDLAAGYSQQTYRGPDVPAGGDRSQSQGPVVIEGEYERKPDA